PRQRGGEADVEDPDPAADAPDARPVPLRPQRVLPVADIGARPRLRRRGLLAGVLGRAIDLGGELGPDGLCPRYWPNPPPLRPQQPAEGDTAADGPVCQPPARRRGRLLPSER